MKKPSVIKKNKKKIILSSIFAIVVSLTGLLVLKTSEPEPCIDILRKSAETESQKMLLPNKDGGLFLLINKDTHVQFIGYLGPKSIETLASEMTNAGLLQVDVKKEGQCVAENGLVYTLATGTYVPAAPKPDPI